jgi:hypothetical protein
MQVTVFAFQTYPNHHRIPPNKPPNAAQNAKKRRRVSDMRLLFLISFAGFQKTSSGQIYVFQNLLSISNTATVIAALDRKNPKPTFKCS